MTETQEKNPLYIHPENLLSSFQRMGNSLAVTAGHFELKTSHEVRDLDWNHMDQLHRPCVHHTYQESLRLVVGSSFALSLTRVGKLKLFTLVADIQLGPGLFYQGFTLFNLVYVHTVIQVLPEEGGSRIVVDSYIVSHRLFKFLHPYLRRRLLRLNEVQNKEDAPIRDQRTQLRSKGYRFKYDHPDYLNSNTLTPNIMPPKLEGTHRISLKGVSTKLSKFPAGPIDLLVRSNSDQSFTVWTAVCPHEAGPLELGQVCNGNIICPWHGLSQEGVQLSAERPQGLSGELQLSLEGEELVVRQLVL